MAAVVGTERNFAQAYCASGGGTCMQGAKKENSSKDPIFSRSAAHSAARGVRHVKASLCLHIVSLLAASVKVTHTSNMFRR